MSHPLSRKSAMNACLGYDTTSRVRRRRPVPLLLLRRLELTDDGLELRRGNAPMRRLLSRGNTAPYTTFDNLFLVCAAWQTPPGRAATGVRNGAVQERTPTYRTCSACQAKCTTAYYAFSNNAVQYRLVLAILQACALNTRVHLQSAATDGNREAQGSIAGLIASGLKRSGA